MKKILSLALAIVLCGILPLAVLAADDAVPVPTDQEAKYAARSVILMDADTGTVLFEQNADEGLPPASVTKIMTLLLVMEAIDEGRASLTDTVTASEHAASMGGSQIYLKVGEQMSVEDLVKSVVISSANDAALALAEHIYGSEEAFVAEMNKRAQELGMQNSHFENTNGLDDTVQNHVMSARDIALASRALMRHETILQYSSIWMDTIRNGAFGLTNTNRLVRFYEGCTGLKTGSTSKAKFCISATAKRDGMHLIAVVMGAETRDERNDIARQLLDWGFANYALYSDGDIAFDPLTVLGGVADTVEVEAGDFSYIVDKGKLKQVRREIELKQKLAAPIEDGEEVGRVRYFMDDREIGSVPITTCSGVSKISFKQLLVRLFERFVIA